MNPTNDSIREEFLKEWGGTNIPPESYIHFKDVVPTMVKIADWWLSKKEGWEVGARSDERTKLREVIKKWKNEGENPTETDLVLENILKALPPTN